MKWLTSLFYKNKSVKYIYGFVNGQKSRKDDKNGNVQFILWLAGEQGHTEDFWCDYDSSWWQLFEPEMTIV